MDKKLKPPQIPPKDRLISDEELKKMEKLGKKITAVLEVNLTLIHMRNKFVLRRKARIIKNIKRRPPWIVTGIRISSLKSIAICTLADI